MANEHEITLHLEDYSSPDQMLNGHLKKHNKLKLNKGGYCAFSETI